MSQKDVRNARGAAAAERERREKEREEFKKAQELESLRRAFKRIDKNGDGAIDCDELLEEVRPHPARPTRARAHAKAKRSRALRDSCLRRQLKFLGHMLRPSEAALTIWEVDDDADGKVDWDEFRNMFYRIRDDQTGFEPRKLFNVVEFIMHDKNFTGSIDLDEAVTMLYARFGKDQVDHAMSTINTDDGTSEKSMSFSTYVKIQASAQKASRDSGLKVGATMVPQVKDLVFATDPTLAHLM